ncbi:hypothetical protein AVEN_120482-1 [Araneus ventricosus]|uniref:Uncharacterized protein n=1 Tax=Araneus ventricosus TaxID=182803 RepID=A0A4Y2UT18_ARAVE|nr:hypothetical protein AVEN_120482-1 [Araneus ventricosus]
MLHLRHLLNSLNDATTGPKEFCRPTGKAFETCEELPVAPFSPISVENMPHNADRMVLSNNQQYLYDICLAISRVECYSDLAIRKPSAVAHSRWLTIASRILKFYVVTEKPSFKLIILATYIMKHIDGQTVGPKSFSGPIGQQLTCCDELPVVDYKPIYCSIPDIDRNLLSKDQQYLLDISNAITFGHCP